jgi:hypothetical protein
MRHEKEGFSLSTPPPIHLSMRTNISKRKQNVNRESPVRMWVFFVEKCKHLSTKR